MFAYKRAQEERGSIIPILEPTGWTKKTIHVVVYRIMLIDTEYLRSWFILISCAGSGTLPIVRTPSNSFSEEELYPNTPSHRLPSSHHSLSKPKRLVHPAPTSPGDIRLTSSLPPHLANIHTNNHKHVTFEGSSKPKRKDEVHSQLPPVKNPDSGTGMEQESVSESHSNDHPDSSEVDTTLAAPSRAPAVSETDSASSHKTHSRSNSDLYLTPFSSPHHSPPPSPPTSPPPSPPSSHSQAVNARRVGDRFPQAVTSHQFETFFTRAPQK